MTRTLRVGPYSDGWMGPAPPLTERRQDTAAKPATRVSWCCQLRIVSGIAVPGIRSKLQDDLRATCLISLQWYQCSWTSGPGSMYRAGLPFASSAVLLGLPAVMSYGPLGDFQERQLATALKIYGICFREQQNPHPPTLRLFEAGAKHCTVCFCQLDGHVSPGQHMSKLKKKCKFVH